jgi:hypothetical protein
MMNELHQNALFIRKWLEMNARYHDMTYTGSEAYDTARHYAEKLDIHEHGLIKNNENIRKPFSCFKIRIGKPKFRGSNIYTLLPHSLMLSTATNNIRIKADYNPPKWYESLVQALYGNRRRRSITRALSYASNGDFSAHPHIGSDGTPCLGGWANAWSQTISTGNLISLVPVTKSFLNTWTSHDAYWNINSTYRLWAVFPLWARKEIPFAIYMAKINLFDNFQRDLDSERRVSMAGFPRWVLYNNELVQQLLMDGFSLEKLMDGFYGSYLKFHINVDTVDRHFSRLQQAMRYIQDIYYLTLEKTRNHLPCSEQMAGALVTQAFMGQKERYIDSPWDNGPSRTASQENSLIIDYVNNNLRSISNSDHSTSNYSRDCTLIDILDFLRHMNNSVETAYKRESYLTKDDMLSSIRHYLRNQNNTYSFFEYSSIINAISKFNGIEGTLEITDSDEDSDTLALNFLNHMIKIYDWQNHSENNAYGENMSKIAEQFAYIALDQYENLLLKTIKRRTQNGKNKIRPTLQDNGTRVGEQQSQISIESF